MSDNHSQAAGEVDETRARLLEAIMPHVVFDGWTNAALRAASADAGLTWAEACAACPRGALDLAAEFHLQGDRAMETRLRDTNTNGLRQRERIALAIRLRLEVIADKEAVRRASALFALPQHAAEGARLMWGTADLIWRSLGDRSDDLNWYTKRASLAAILGASVLYWLGDTSENNSDTAGFIDRRIEGMMQIQKTNDALRRNPATRGLMQIKDWAESRVRAPVRIDDLPGRLQP